MLQALGSNFWQSVPADFGMIPSQFCADLGADFVADLEADFTAQFPAGFGPMLGWFWGWICVWLMGQFCRVASFAGDHRGCREPRMAKTTKWRKHQLPFLFEVGRKFWVSLNIRHYLHATICK
jgi:hypothetical protein